MTYKLRKRLIRCIYFLVEIHIVLFDWEVGRLQLHAKRVALWLFRFFLGF